MEKANSSNPSPLQNLPDDLKAIIFEYVSALDYANLSLVCRDFRSFLLKNTNQWARHLFKGFLDVVPRGNSFSQGSEANSFEHALVRNEDKIKFSEMIDSRRLLVQHYNVMKRWKSFFGGFLSSRDCATFINDVFNALEAPSYPPPCLKKDIHYFPTNTLFQNFLTEVHFEVEGRPFIQEKKQTIVEKMAKRMNENLLDRKISKDDLVTSRWYLFNRGKKNVESLRSDLKASLLCPKTKVIKKRAPVQRKANFSKKSKYVQKKMLKNDKSPKTYSTTTQTLKTLRNNERSLQKYEAMSLKSSKPEDVNVEEFYWILYDLMENYCKMVFTYLRAIRDPYLLIGEYVRLWNRYALLIMDFTQTFNPFADLFNTLYEDVCRGLPCFPKFSTWRLMVKVWISQVFSNLNYYLGEAFRAILMKVRSQKKSCCMQKTGDTENCPLCRATQNNDGSNAPYDHLFYKVARTDKERKDIPVEDLVQMLKGFYNAVDDVSYNEFSIFYWDCTPNDKRTPKRILDSLVLQDTKVFYDYFKECFWQGSSHYKTFLDEDTEFVEQIFGKQFGSEIRQLQSSAIKDYLADIFNHAVQETESSVKVNNKIKDSMISRRKSSIGSHINLRELCRFLSIDDEMQKKILETQNKKELLTARLTKDGRVLNSYMFYLEKEQEEIASQIMELEDMRSHRALRGFVVADDRYDKFFELDQNPSLTDLEKVVLEGKNLQEEVEQPEESIVFL